MDYKVLGRTGLSVSVAGLGCGGHSRLGQAYGISFDDSVAVVRAAMDLGINFIDTAWAYGTEPIVGAAIEGRRDKIVLSTKTHIMRRDGQDGPYRLVTATALARQLNENLERLKTDYVDVFNLHAVRADQLDYVHTELVPVLKTAQAAGQIRFLGITEQFAADPGHAMLQGALASGLWDVIMVGFNLLNPSARERVFPLAIAHDIGTQIMFAVRRALSHGAALREALQVAIDAGQLARDAFDPADPLGFVTRDSDATGLVEAAYRFCRHEPGAHVVLTGTGRVAHLTDNVASIMKGPLPESVQTRLRALFGAVDCISGN